MRKEWIGAIAKFLGLQLGVQALGFVAGLVLVRGLSAETYGWFTLLTGLLTTVQLLADTGSGSALASVGGRVWPEPERFHALLQTVAFFRRNIAALAFVLTATVYALSLPAGQKPLLSVAAALVAVLAAAVFTQVRCDVFGPALRLVGRATATQQIDFAANAARIACFAAILLTVETSGGTDFRILLGCLAAVVGVQWLQGTALHRALRPYLVPGLACLMADRVSLRGLFRAQVVYNLLFCVQGQLGLLLLAAHGAARALGDFGALGRVAAVFTIFNALQNGLILPAFARVASDAGQLRRRFWFAAGAGAALAVALGWFAWLFPRPFLWLIGEQYLHLELELGWMMALSALAYLGAVLWSLNYARGWVRGSWAIPLASLAVQAAAVPWVDFSTVRGALILGCIGALPALPLNIWLMSRGLSDLAPDPVPA